MEYFHIKFPAFSEPRFKSKNMAYSVSNLGNFDIFIHHKKNPNEQ